MNLTTIEIRGRDFEVSVNQAGEFMATIDGNQMKAPSLEQLRHELMRATKAVKIDVPFVQWKDGKIQKGSVTGRHATNRNYMVKWESEKGATQVAAWDLDRCVAPAFAEEYARLSAAADAAIAARQDFEKIHKYDVRKLADAALEKEGAS